VVLRIDFKSSIQPAVRDDVLFERVIQVAFGQRRKTLRNALSSGRLPLTSAAAAQLLTATGINPHRRAETLSVDEFVGLSNCIGQYLA
jgi:16S rRNA (adenine1518-N6/adenine1519-N6)-dimethyltransferase